MDRELSMAKRMSTFSALAGSPLPPVAPPPVSPAPPVPPPLLPSHAATRRAAAPKKDRWERALEVRWIVMWGGWQPVPGGITRNRRGAIFLFEAVPHPVEERRHDGTIRVIRERGIVELAGADRADDGPLAERLEDGELPDTGVRLRARLDERVARDRIRVAERAVVRRVLAVARREPDGRAVARLDERHDARVLQIVVVRNAVLVA